MNRPSFQFYPADYLSDMKVRMLSWSSRGLYIELLCYCWREGWIPADSSAIAQLWGCHDLAIIEPCLRLFRPHPDDPEKLIHKRLEDEKLKQDSHRKERSESGKRGAKARWDKEKQESDSSANGSAIKEPMAKNGSSTSTSTSTSTSSSTKKPLSAEADEKAYPDFIEALWREFPAQSRDRSSKKQVYDQWKQLRPKPSEDALIESVKAWSKSKDWSKDGGQFATGAHRFLKARKFESMPEATKTSGKHAGIQTGGFEF